MRDTGSVKIVTSANKSSLPALPREGGIQGIAGDPNSAELSALVVRGVGWKIFSQTTVQITRIVVGIMLARLLTPSEFGLAAMALVLSGFIVPFADVGLGAALVQRKEITDDDCSTVFWASIGAGVLLTGGLILAAPAIGSFYGNSQVTPLVAVLSTGFIITALGSTHRSLLVRSMNFRSLEVRYVIGSVASGAVAVALALAKYGAWAFVAQELVLAGVSTVLLWFVLPWRPRFRFGWANLRDLGGFGIRVLGGAFFRNLNGNTDNLLIGKYIGAAALGLYAFAYNLMLLPVSRIVAPLQQVVFPAFSRVQDDRARLASMWLRANRLIAAVCAPLLLGAMITAPALIPLVFGGHWRPAVPVVRILCWVGILQCVSAINDSVLQAGNGMKAYIRFMACSFAVNVSAFVIGLHWGIIGVAAAFAVSSTLLLVVYTVLVTRSIGIAAPTFVRAFAGLTQALVGATAVALLVWIAVTGMGVIPLIQVIATTGAGLAAYAGLLGWREPQLAREVRGLIASRRTSPTLRTSRQGGADAVIST